MLLENPQMNGPLESTMTGGNWHHKAQDRVICKVLCEAYVQQSTSKRLRRSRYNKKNVFILLPVWSVADIPKVSLKKKAHRISVSESLLK